MTAGASADAWAADAGRLRWWQHIAAAVGVETPGMAQKKRLAGQKKAGAEGERRTAQLLKPLEREGWHVLHDLALPGSKANVDTLLVAPDGRVFTLDSKLWSAKWPIRAERDRLFHGRVDRDDWSIRPALRETELVERALGVPVTPLIVVHNAPVEGGGFHVRGVSVFPADRLVELLRHNIGRPNPREVRRLVQLAEVRLPPYVK